MWFDERGEGGGGDIYTEYGISSSVSARSLKLSNAGPDP